MVTSYSNSNVKGGLSGGEAEALVGSKPKPLLFCPIWKSENHPPGNTCHCHSGIQEIMEDGYNVLFIIKKAWPILYIYISSNSVDIKWKRRFADEKFKINQN